MSKMLHNKDYFLPDGFPLAVMRRFPQPSTRRHAHQFTELVIVSKGSGVHCAGRESWPISAGDAFVIAGAHSHEYRDTDGLVIANILFDPCVLDTPERDLRELPGYHALFTLEPAMRTRGSFRSRMKLSIPALCQVDGLVEKLDRELSAREPGYRSMALAAFVELAGILARCYEQVNTASMENLLQIGKAISYLETQYAENVRLDEVARAAHLSRRHLLRRFKDATGVTPFTYLLNVRVARGAERLRSGEANVSEAALTAGFVDSNYFSRQFRRRMGVSPREYRRKHVAASRVYCE